MRAARAAGLAVLVLAAVPFGGTASARCAPDFHLVCAAYAAACDEVPAPLDRYCSLHP